MRRSGRVSQQFGLAQSNALRIAIDMVVLTLGDRTKLSRTEIARIALSTANEGDFSAATIAKMALRKIDDLGRTAE
jgi:hypothetical protein